MILVPGLVASTAWTTDGLSNNVGFADRRNEDLFSTKEIALLRLTFSLFNLTFKLWLNSPSLETFINDATQLGGGEGRGVNTFVIND